MGDMDENADVATDPQHVFPPPSSRMIQAVDYDEHFNDELNTFLRSERLTSVGFDYHVASILGAQSSGKSTLLNLLFGTEFSTMDETNGRYQVTQGVWLGLDISSKTVVLDLEGTDSRERGEGAINFERKIALFALALSEVLIVNIWAQDVGRYNAANLDLLKTVMELDLQLFYGSSTSSASPEDDESNSQPSARMHKTRLLFVLRDHVSSPLDKLYATIRDDVDNIWATIQKPEPARGIPITKFFDIDFFALPHKLLMEQSFLERGAELRRRFCDGEVFQEEYQSGIAADGFSEYARNVWETIRANRELDIPSQKEMLAHVRCEQIGREAIDIFEKAIADVRQSLLPEADDEIPIVVPDLLERLTEAADSATKAYKNAACRYARSVADAKGADVATRIGTDAKTLLDAQMEVAGDAATSTARAELETRDKYDAPWEDWAKCRVALQNDAEHTFDAACGAHTASELSDEHPLSFAKSAINGERRRVRSRVNEDISRFDASVRSRAQACIVDTFSAAIRTPVTKAVETADADVWTRISDVVNAAWVAASSSTRASFGADGVGLDDSEVEDVIEDDMKPDCLARAYAVIRDAVGPPAHVLMRMTKRFDDAFRFDERGVPRHFGPRDDVKVAFVEARNAAEALVDSLADVRLEGEVTCIRSSKDNVNKKKSTGETTSLLDSSTREELRDKLKRQAGAVFVEVKRAQEAARITTKVPMWLLLLVLILGWNEFMAVIRSPVLLLLTVLVAPMIYVGYMIDAPTLLGPAVGATVTPYVEQAKAVVRQLAAPSGEAATQTLGHGQSQAQPGMMPGLSGSSSTASDMSGSSTGGLGVSSSASTVVSEAPSTRTNGIPDKFDPFVERTKMD